MNTFLLARENRRCLPGDLTVDKIKLGWAEMRNPLTAQLCAKTMPYRGLGSGITRALKSGEHIDLVNDIERDKFVATIWRDNVPQVGISHVPKEEIIANNVPQDVSQGDIVPQGGIVYVPQGAKDVPEDVPQGEANGTDLDAWIIERLAETPQISTEELAVAAKVSSKTIKRHISKMSNVRYVGSGYSGHWEVTE